MELTLLMLLTGTLALTTLLGAMTPAAEPPRGALSDLDMSILDDDAPPAALPRRLRAEDRAAP